MLNKLKLAVALKLKNDKKNKVFVGCTCFMPFRPQTILVFQSKLNSNMQGDYGVSLKATCTLYSTMMSGLMPLPFCQYSAQIISIMVSGHKALHLVTCHHYQDVGPYNYNLHTSFE